MTDEERNLKAFTRPRLMKLKNWKDWDASFEKQMDQYYRDGTFGAPVRRFLGAHILLTLWSCLVKPDGRRKCRCCINGSRRAAPWLREGVQTYSSCLLYTSPSPRDS